MKRTIKQDFQFHREFCMKGNITLIHNALSLLLLNNYLNEIESELIKGAIRNLEAILLDFAASTNNMKEEFGI